MFDAFRCEDCVHGDYCPDKDTWDCDLDIVDEDDCEANYEDDDRM